MTLPAYQANGRTVTRAAFYAALMRVHTDVPLAAGYLAVDSAKGIVEIPHPQVEHSAAALVQGLASDLRRLRGGSGLRALGEGPTCEYCAARGVCRRDHWATDSGAPADAPAPLAPGPPGR